MGNIFLLIFSSLKSIPIPNLFEINTLTCETKQILLFIHILFVSVKLLALGVDIRIRITTQAGASKFPEGKKEI